MAKTWYFAKCAKCMKATYVMVKSPSYTAHMYAEEKEDQRVFDFLQKHYGCELTLGWRDDHLDQLWEEGYTSADLH